MIVINDWIQEFAIKTYAAYSPVALIDTNDPKRSEQFISWALKNYKQVFVFDSFHGLRLAKKDENTVAFEQIKAKSSNPLSIGNNQQEPITNPVAAIQYLHEVKEQKHCLVMELVDPPADLLWDLGKDPELFLHEHSVVIFTPNATKLPQFVRDICINIEPPISTEEERKEILKQVSKTFHVRFNGKEVNALAGLNLHETQSVLLESIARHKEISLDTIASFKKEIIKRSGVLEVLSPLPEGFAGIGGYNLVKDFVSVNVVRPLLKPSKAKNLGLRLPRGLLLFGPPGTGKTLFAKALAKELKLPAVELLTENIFSKYVGESEGNLKRALRLIDEISPCVVFIDEVDRLGNRSQGDGDSGTSRRVFGQLLSWLGDKERKAIVVATTNTPETLDFAFIRSGRFDYRIPFLLPDENARLAILQVHTSIQRKVPLDSNVSLSDVARATSNFSGAELEELVIRAARNAFKRDSDTVIADDFEAAIDSFRINFSERQEQTRHYLELAERFTDDAQFLKQLKASYADRTELLKQKMGV